MSIIGEVGGVVFCRLASREIHDRHSLIGPFLPINFMVNYACTFAPHLTGRKVSGGVIFLRRTAR